MTCDAFVLGDWTMIEGDFDADAFEGIRCNHSPDPDRWEMALPRLEDYRDGWLIASNPQWARATAKQR